MRMVILGRGGSGKSTFAARLGMATRVPCTELDTHFWGPALEMPTRDRWIETRDSCKATYVCAWRALRRSEERADFWRRLLSWERRSRHS